MTISNILRPLGIGCPFSRFPKKVIVAGHFYVRQNNQPALGGKSQYFFL
jgi:hypothetical protein